MYTKRVHVLRTLVTLIFSLCCLHVPGWAQGIPLDGLLPADTSGWHLIETPRSFVGDELFSMIDGGAALYQEYGFDRAISGKYEDGAGRGIDVEIYAMSDAGAAYGIFSITALAGEHPIQLGDDGELGEYFVVFRKGRRVVTISGQSSDTTTMEAVKRIGRAVEMRIDSGGAAPPLVRQFESVVAPGSRPVYLRGVIGVGNFYLFAPKNVFHVREGITGEQRSVRFFVFRYADAAESARSLRAAVGAFKVDAKYSDVRSTGDRLEAIDRDGNLLRGSTVGNAIAVVIGRDAATMRTVEAKILERMKTP
jgi:hypothetical protein